MENGSVLDDERGYKTRHGDCEQAEEIAELDEINKWSGETGMNLRRLIY